MSQAAPAFEVAEREAPDTRARRKAVVKHLRVSALSLNQGTRNAPDSAPNNWNNESFICQRASSSIDSCTRRAVAHVLFKDAPEKNRVERGRCGHRLCPHCHKVIATKVGMALTEIVTAELIAGANLAMLTLPIKHTRNDALKTCRKAVSKGNADLIKRELWKSLIAEYHRVGEVERGRKNGWNAHYHVLCKVRYSHEMAQALWRDGWFDLWTATERSGRTFKDLKVEKKRLLKAAKDWKRGEMAALREKRKEWRDAGERPKQRLQKSREARAAIDREFARRAELPLQLAVFWWWYQRPGRKRKLELESIKRATRKELARLAALRKSLKVAGELDQKTRKRLAGCRAVAIAAFDAAKREAWASNPDLRGSAVLQFLTITPHEIEDWLRDEWRAVTSKLGRESHVLRYEAWKPGTEAGTIRWQKKVNKKPVGEPFNKPVVKAVQELVKYSTKGHSKALKKGQVGFFEYAPWEVADYLKGVKNWHLHQSSRGWIAAQHAYEAETKGIQAQAENEEGSKRVSFVELVKDLEDAVNESLTPDQVDEVIADGVAILNLWKKEHSDDPEFSTEQLAALSSHLARLLGDDRSPVEAFKLTLPEKRELNRLRGRASGPGIDIDQLLLAVRDRKRELLIAQRVVADLPYELQFTLAGKVAMAALHQAEARARYAEESVRAAEQRKRDEIYVDRCASEEREKAISWALPEEEEAYAL